MTSVVPAQGAVTEAVGGAAFAGAMAGEVARLASQIFAQLPGAVPFAPPPRGGGGASMATALPPLPGVVHQPPIAGAPPPRESDLRGVPTQVSHALGLGSPLALALVGPADASSSAPYFLDIAGLPSTGSLGGAGGAAAAQPAGAPAAPAGGSQPSSPSQPSTSSIPPSAVPTTAAMAASSAAPASSTEAVTATGPAIEAQPLLVPEIGGRTGSTPGVFDAVSIKRDFPILRERVHGRPLIWLDNAATTQKPQAVIDRVSYYYEHENSNVHRAAHALAARATDAYEGAREKVRRFLNAPSVETIVFARGATEAINLVAQSWGRRNVGAGDEIVITWLEHHANIVPWQQLCSEKGARLCVAPVDDRGQIILDEFERLLGPKTRLVSFAHVSNALGTIVPAGELVKMAHRHGARVLVDGAQAVSHMPVDVQALDCDFYCFSGHKLFAPTGIGALFGKTDVLATMPPWQGGGNMIRDVTFERTTYQPPPWRFEAGTGSIADAVGLGAAIDYLSALGLANVARYEHELLVYATEELACVPGLRMIGTSADKTGVLSFVIDGVRTEDVGAALDQEGIAVRSGHHCAQPILRRFGLESTVRASLAPYNTRDDIDALVAALLRLQTGRLQTR